MIGEAIVGFDSSKMREGGDESGYVVGFWAQPSREPRYQIERTPSGAEFEVRDTYGYRIALPAPPRAIFRIGEAGQFSHATGVTLEDVVSAVSARAKAWGASTVVADDFESASLGALFSQRGLRKFLPYAWSNGSKSEAVATLRRMIREQTLSITPHDGLRREMLDLKFRMTRSGAVDYRTHGKDLVSALISIAHYFNDPDAAGLSQIDARPLAGSPLRARAGGMSERRQGRIFR